MNGKLGVLSLFHFLSFAIFLAFSALFFSIYFSPDLRLQLSNALLTDDNLLLFSAISFFIWTLSFTTIMYFFHKGSFYSFRMQSHSLDVDSQVIKETIQAYLDEKHPEIYQDIDVLIHRNQNIEVLMKAKNGAPSLKVSEQDIGKILADLLDYDREFLLTIH